MIDAQGLTKRFGSLAAVTDVSFAVARGQVLGLIGPNGAGKSTTLKMLAGFLPPDGGRATICGFDVARAPTDVKRHIGYLPEGAPAYGDMAVGDFLEFVAAVRGLSGPRKRDRLDAVIHRMRLAQVLGQPVDTVSKGFKRRVGIAQALVHDPDVLILDEPTAGLDPNQKHEVHQLIREAAAEKAIIVSTHLLDEVESLCSGCVVLTGGRVAVSATPEELQSRSAYHNAVVIRLGEALVPRTLDVLKRLPRVATVAPIERVGGRREVADLLVVPKPGETIIESVSDALNDYRLPVDELRLERGRLDDVFRQLTGAA